MKGTRHLPFLAGLAPVGLGEAAGLVHIGGLGLPLEQIAPLCPAGFGTVVHWTLAVVAPIFVGSAIALVARLLDAAPTSRPVRVGWLIGLELLFLAGGAGVAGVALVALLALTAVSVAQAGSLILAESPTAGIASGLALAGAMLLVPATALSGIAVALTLVASVARRGHAGAGFAFAAVVGFPPLALVAAAPFVDWRLAGNLRVLRAFLAAGWPLAPLVGLGVAVALVAVALGALLPARLLPLGLALAAASGGLAGAIGPTLVGLAVLAALVAMMPWWGAALRGVGGLPHPRPAMLTSD